MEVDISKPHNNARLAGTLSFNDSGSNHSKLLVYTAPKPDPGDAITTQDLLVEIPLDKPSGTINTGASTLSMVSSASPIAVASGAAVWARQLNGNGDWSTDYDVTDAAGDGAVKIEDTDILAGGVVALVSGILR